MYLQEVRFSFTQSMRVLTLFSSDGLDPQLSYQALPHRHEDPFLACIDMKEYFTFPVCIQWIFVMMQDIANSYLTHSFLTDLPN